MSLSSSLSSLSSSLQSLTNLPLATLFWILSSLFNVSLGLPCVLSARYYRWQFNLIYGRPPTAKECASTSKEIIYNRRFMRNVALFGGFYLFPLLEKDSVTLCVCAIGAVLKAATAYKLLSLRLANKATPVAALAAVCDCGFVVAFVHLGKEAAERTGAEMAAGCLGMSATTMSVVVFAMSV